MDHGVIEQYGTPVDIYRDPASLFVADFIGEINRLPGVVDGKDRVRIGAVSLACPTDPLREGQACTVVVRPEDMILVAADDPGESHDGFGAVVEEVEFLGAAWHLQLRCPEIGDRPLTVNVSTNRARSMNIREGMRVSLSFVTERLRAFAQGTDGR